MGHKGRVFLFSPQRNTKLNYQIQYISGNYSQTLLDSLKSSKARPEDTPPRTVTVSQGVYDVFVTTRDTFYNVRCINKTSGGTAAH